MHLAYYPELELTAVILADDEDTPVERIQRRVLRAILDQPEPGVHDWPLTPEELARYAGEYLLGCTRLVVGIEGDRLTLDRTAHPVERLLYQGRNQFVVGIDPEVRLEFELEDDRAVSFVFDDRGQRAVAVRVGE